jgi:hypothetical protein
MDGMAGLSLFDARAGGEKQLAEISEGSLDSGSCAKIGPEQTKPVAEYPPREFKFLAMNLVVRLIPTGWKFWGNSVLLKTPVGESGPVNLPEPYTWTWAGPEEIDFLARHPEATSRSAYARRAARGDRCLCIKQGADIVGYRWFKLTPAASCAGLGQRGRSRLFRSSQTSIFL